MKKYLGAALFLYSSFTFSAQMPVQATHDGTVVMNIYGEIDNNDGLQFINVAEAWRRSGNPVQMVYLNSGGGNVISGYIISNYILRNRIATIVPDGNLCASACFNIFIAGYPRIATNNSQLGVHRVSVGSYDTPVARDLSIDMNDYYKVMGVSDKLRLAMLDTPPNQMYWLSYSDKQNISTNQPSYTMGVKLFDSANINSSKTTLTEQSKAKARSLNKEAIPLIWSENYSLAISKLEQAKQLNPSDAEVLGNLGFAYQKMGDLTNAQINFTASLKLSPKRGATWGNLADLLAETNQIEWAIDAFVKYYTYSKNKQAALNFFYTWMERYPNTGRDMAVRNAMARLGLY